MPIATLDRTILRFSGDNLKPWLAGLITNNLDSPLTFAALLTPQGKIIADFFIHQDQTRWGDDLILETPVKFGDLLQKRLKMYKLREKIDMIDVTDSLHLYALWDGQGDLGAPDPRHEALGARFISDELIEITASEAEYDSHRLGLSIPDSAYDFDTQQRFPADVNMDLLKGVDFKKGCFIGQEVVSRMYRKTEVRKRFRAIRALEGALTETGPIKAGERIIGECLHIRGAQGMALIRLDRLEGADESLMLDNQPVIILDPSYGNKT